MLYPKDPKVRVEKHGKTLRIEWNWGGSSGLVFVVLGLVCLAAILFCATLPGYDGEPRRIGDILGFVVMALIVGGPMIYGGFAYWFNKTMIHADHERLIVRSGPMPWRKSVLKPCDKVHQFFIGPSANGTHALALHMMDDDSYQYLLAPAFPSRFAAYQVCHELQDWFGLEDLPIYGQNTLPHQPAPRKK